MINNQNRESTFSPIRNVVYTPILGSPIKLVEKVLPFEDFAHMEASGNKTAGLSFLNGVQLLD